VHWTTNGVVPGAKVELRRRVWSKFKQQYVQYWYVQMIDFTPTSFQVTDEVRKGPTVLTKVTPADVKGAPLLRKAEVFSIDAVAHSMTKYYEFPRCGISLILDTRMDPPMVRPFHMLEMWLIQALPEEWYHELVSLGFTERDIASLAGNCIASTTLKPQLEVSCKRIHDYFSSLAQAPSLLVPWMHPGAPLKPGHKRVVLLPTRKVDQGLVVLHGGAHLPFIGQAITATRDSAVEMASRWMHKLSPKLQSKLVCFVAGVFKEGEGETIVVACPIMDDDVLTSTSISPEDKWWRPLSQVEGSEAVYTATASAMVAVQQLTGWGVVRIGAEAIRVATTTKGKIGPHRILKTPLVAPGVASVEKGYDNVRLMPIQNQLNILRMRLACTPSEHEHSEWMRGWADLVRPVDPTHIPESLMQGIDNSSEAITMRKSCHRPLAQVSKAMVPPTIAEVPTDFHPKSIKDLMHPEVVQEHHRLRMQWEESAARNLAMAAEGAPFPHLEAMAMGRRHLHPKAQNHYWLDPEVFGPGDPEVWEADDWWPLDHTKLPIESNFNVSRICGHLQDTPDKQMMSFMQHGVSFYEEFDFQAVYQDNMKSLSTAYTARITEVKAMIDRAWYKPSPRRAIWPSRSIPGGLVPRPDKPEQPRAIANGSAPHEELIDSCGVPVLSINALTGLREVYPGDEEVVALPKASLPAPSKQLQSKMRKQAAEMRWPQEVKPTHVEIANNTLILSQPAKYLDGSPVGFVCDFWRYFHQFPYAPWMWPSTMVMWGTLNNEATQKGDKLPPSITWIVSLCMDMGVSAASGIAQRFADHILDQFTILMDEWEDFSKKSSILLSCNG
jgi:hypothetical protein